MTPTHPHETLRAGLFMVAASASFVTNDTCVKLLAGELPVGEIVAIRDLIREIGRSRTVILSTHILQEVQATCDRVIIINKGEIAADGPTQEVTLRDQGGRLLRVTYTAGKVAPRRERVVELAQALPGVERVRTLEDEDPEHMSLEVLASGDPRPALFQLAVDQGLVMLELTEERSNLEEVFRRLTRA